MEKLFLGLFVLIIVIANLFYYYLLKYKTTSQEKFNNAASLTLLYLFTLFCILILWMFSLNYAKPRFYFLIIISVCYSFWAFSATIASNVLIQIVEEKIENVKKVYFHFGRLLIIAFGAFCINSSLSFTKASMYNLNISDYFFGKKIENHIEQYKSLKLDENELEKQELFDFEFAVEKLTANYFTNKKGNIFSWFSNYRVLEGTHKIKLEYYFLPASEGSPPVHRLDYFPQGAYQKSCSVPLTIFSYSRLDSINKSLMIKSIAIRKTNLDSIKTQIAENPAPVLSFAYSNFMNTLGFRGYSMEPVNSKTHYLDNSLDWTYTFISSVLLFYLLSNWIKRKSE